MLGLRGTCVRAGCNSGSQVVICLFGNENLICFNIDLRFDVATVVFVKQL